jgi:hypothetical protein
MRMFRPPFLALLMLMACPYFNGCTSVNEPPPPPATIQEIDRGRMLAAEQAIKTDGELAGEGIQVSAKGDTLVLSGSVQTDDEKQRAERLAKTTRGITKVENDLVVKPRTP